MVAGGRTGTVVALAAPDGSRTLTSDRGTSGELGPGDVGEGMLAGAVVLHVAGYTLLRDAGAEAALLLARAARRYGARVTADLSTAHGIEQLGRERMRDRVAALEPDIVFANETEAAVFGKPIGDVWVVKRGPLGCTVERDGERLEFAAVALDGVVDTTGAGDAFAAGFLLGGEPEDAAQRRWSRGAEFTKKVRRTPVACSSA